MVDEVRLDELLKLSAKFDELSCGANEYPDRNDEKLLTLLNTAQKYDILDRDYSLIFHIINSRKEEGEPGCGPVLFNDSYDWENEEYRGDYNMSVYTEISKDADYSACELVYRSLPPDVQVFYMDALFDELQYNLDEDIFDSFKAEWAMNYAPTRGDGHEEDQQELRDLIDKHEDDVKKLLSYGFRF